MFPRYLPYGQLPSVPGLNALLGVNLGLPVEAATIAPTQDISSLLFSAHAGLAAPYLSAASSYLLPQSNQFINGLPASGSMSPHIPHLSLSPMVPVFNPSLLFYRPISDLSATSQESSDAHTIVRAPVIYGNNSSNAVSRASKVTSKSPPDQIVASYAAAARAAAIAYQQPLSNAAEVFLSAAASAAGTLAGSNGQAITTAKSRAVQRRNYSGVAVTSPPITAASTGGLHPKPSTKSTDGGSKPPLPWNSTWTRIVDRQADVVVYISPGGSRLKSVEEVRAHLQRWLPPERASAISDECVNASFCFDANREARLVSAPDDSIFVFPEEGETSPAHSPSVNADFTVHGSTSDATTSDISEGPPTTSASRKRPATNPDFDAVLDATESPSTSTSEVILDGDIKASETIDSKRVRIESTSCAAPLTTLLSRNSDTALTTPSFVARGVARMGGGTTVVPSVVPSVLPPASSTPCNYGLAHHLIAMHQHQALIAAAGLLQPHEATHQQLLEHFKQQQAAALILHQHQQHHQLEQHIQAVYAAALQQQAQQTQQDNP
ncbi:unnamed protein product [Mesocestoides corti]|uniref:MBD domain-containing protein n=1 Tax=Mesocestoides corti TaxID=53468 RepID=A0A0R3UFL0_MESCO|nr:unnamed protein product [Mesocestoides corti]